jgi:hypothetical protein
MIAPNMFGAGMKPANKYSPERHRLPTMFVMHEANDSASDFCSSITDLKPTELAYRRLIGLTSAQSSSLS